MHGLILLSVILHFVGAHEKVIMDLGKIEAHGQINQMLQIKIGPPGSLIHSAMTTIPQDSKYMVVHPATVYPLPIFNNYKYNQLNSIALMLPTKTPTLLQDLRTYRSAHYNDIVVCKEFVFMLLLPNKIVIAKQRGSGEFKIQNQYVLDELTEKSTTKMYRIDNNEEVAILLVVQNSNTFYKLGIQQFQRITVQKAQKIHHIQFISNDEFVAATGGAVKLYKITKNQIKLINSYSCQNLNLTQINSIADNKIDVQIQFKQNLQCQITDLSLNLTSNEIYILDSKSGLHRLSFTKQDNEKSFALLDRVSIAEIKDCEALDLVSSQYFVLVCQVGMPNSYIQQIIQFEDPIVPNKSIIVKKDPIYHNCNFNDLVVTPDYFLFFDSYTIDVFWNSAKIGSYSQLSTEHSKQHFNIPGLEVFTIKTVENKTFLYVVESNFLTKYQLVLFQGSIYIYSPIPIQKQIKIQLPAKCDETKYSVLTKNKEINKNYQCFYEAKIGVKIEVKSESATKQKVSMSIGAIVIMLAVIIILAWICVVKYRGLEDHARKILYKYQQRSRYNDNKFNI